MWLEQLFEHTSENVSTTNDDGSESQASKQKDTPKSAEFVWSIVE
jgi:hypothetical protein